MANNVGQHFIVYNTHVHDVSSSLSLYRFQLLKDNEKVSAFSNFLVFQIFKFFRNSSFFNVFCSF